MCGLRSGEGLGVGLRIMFVGWLEEAIPLIFG